jgi:hypothetical protein
MKESGMKSREQEIVELRRDMKKVHAIAKGLLSLHRDAFTDEHVDFVEKMSTLPCHWEITHKQCDYLLGLRDSYTWISDHKGFSTASLLARCWEMRDYLSESRADLIDRLKREGSSIRKRDLPALWSCAKDLGVVERYM